MFFKTLAFIALLYILVKFISRFFLPSSGKKNSNARIFYRVFKNIRQQKKQQQQRQQQQKSGGSGNHFDEIEEAEFEEIPEEKANNTE